MAMATQKFFTTRQMILRLIEQNPAQTMAQLARTMGISQQRVSQIVAEEGYTVGLVKRPEPEQKEA